MPRVIIPALAGAVALAVLAGCGSTAATGQSPGSLPSNGAPHTARKASAAAPKPTPIPAAKSYSGTGDDVITISKPDGLDKAAIVKVTGNAGGVADFTVMGAGDQLLVNTTDPYSGTVPLDFDAANQTSRLTITAGGRWTVTVESARSAPKLASNGSGTGDAVLFYAGPGGVAAITGNKGGVADFAVMELTADNPTGNLLVNTTDPYSGRVNFDAGPAYVVVGAAGPWTLAVTGS